MNIPFPARLLPMIASLLQISAEGRNDLSSYASEAVKRFNSEGYLFSADTSKLTATLGQRDLIFSFYIKLTTKQWVKYLYNALVGSGIIIVDRHETKEGQYASTWFELEDCALRICSLRRGGKGVLCYSLEEMRKEVEASSKEKAKVDARNALIESAKAKLTDEEKRALGLS